MTSPDGALPEGSLAPGLFAAAQAMEAEEAKRAATGGALVGFEESQESYWDFEEQIQAELDGFEDSQLELQERVELLNGVRGYCSTYLGANWLVPGNAEKQLPFDSQLGPEKGAVPYNGVGIKLLEKGLWRADAHVSFQVQSGWFTSAALASVYLTVRPVSNPTSIYTRRQFSLVIGRAGDETCAFSNTFVIPEDDAFFVTVELNHRNQRQLVFGGTLRSALSVNKWDFRIDHDVVAPTVPDGGTL